MKLNTLRLVRSVAHLLAGVLVVGCGADAPAASGSDSAASTTSTAASGEAGAGAGGASTGGAGGGGEAGGAVELPDPLGPLPPTEATSTERFETSRACNQCHFAGDGNEVMHDAVSGDDLSPGYTWRSSMMALAARDPYYLAVLSEELLNVDGETRSEVERTCLRCHAPAGSEEGGAALTFDELTTGGSPAANLGRDGVTCSLCHQIEEEGLGTWGSFSGGFSVGDGRRIFGPHAAPLTKPMEFFVDYTPAHAPHVAESRLCATCHTVITPSPGGGDFVEQAPFLEWESSSFAGSTPCGSCHLPAVDSSGAVLESPIATYPEGLAPRAPFGVHQFVGANAYVLSIFADHEDWSGASVPRDELLGAAERSREHLASAARLSIGAVTVVGDELRVPIEVHNDTGHKLPTGYPGRRIWLHLRASDGGGALVFESGAWDDRGRIHGVDDGSSPGALVPHRDEVAPGEVQIWESVPGDVDGRPTHRPLAATSYLKDDRILPPGFVEGGPWTDLVAPVGTTGDASFVGGSDTVTFRVPDAASVARVEVALLYQTLPASAAAHLARVPAPAAVRFSQMVEARPPEVVQIASASLDR